MASEQDGNNGNQLGTVHLKETPQKRIKLRFTVEEDLILLKETVHINPYEDKKRWKEVESNVANATNKKFTARCVREHVEYLINLFLKDDRASLRKSETEEQYNEKKQLLQEIKGLKDNCFPRKMRKVYTRRAVAPRDFATDPIFEKEGLLIDSPIKSDILECNIWNEGDITADNFSYTYSESPELGAGTSNAFYPEEEVVNPTIPGPNITRKKSYLNSITEFLRDKQAMDLETKKQQMEIEKMKIALEERKLSLEEEKFQLHKKEVETKLEMEKNERIHRIKTAELQQQIITILLEKLKK